MARFTLLYATLDAVHKKNIANIKSTVLFLRVVGGVFTAFTALLALKGVAEWRMGARWLVEREITIGLLVAACAAAFLGVARVYGRALRT